MTRPRADREAILIAFLDELGGRLPPHFDLERFGAEADRWAAQGLTVKQIARLLVEQCRACAPPKRSPPIAYFTVEAYRPEGGLFRAVEHVLSSDVAATKRRINREARQRLVYALIRRTHWDAQCAAVDRPSSSGGSDCAGGKSGLGRTLCCAVRIPFAPGVLC
jgi:hypothetical protein